MAEPSASFDVDAFVFMHGAVHPTKLVTGPSEQTPGCYQYAVSGTELRDKTHLYAPKILGKSYYDRPDSDEFISGLIRDWINDYDALFGEYGGSFSAYCLTQIALFEQEHVLLMKQEIKNHNAANAAGLYLDEKSRAQRREFEEGIVEKSKCEWAQHRCSIAEKLYSTIPGDSIPNCIMFFCKELSELSELSVKFSRTQNITVNLPRDRIVEVIVGYDKKTKVFKIRFTNRPHVFHFEEIYKIVRTVIMSISDNDINLSIFDFSCSDIVLKKDDECLRGLTPQFMSGQDANVTFGSSHLEPPIPTLAITLFGGVESFVDFKSSVFPISWHVSPPRPGPAGRGGGRRPRVFKKVSRKRNTRGRRNGRFRAKGSNRRTRRKQK